MQIKKAEIKLKSIHVNLMTDNATQKLTAVDESSITKEEKQSYSGTLCIFLFFKYLIYSE